MWKSTVVNRSLFSKYSIFCMQFPRMDSFKKGEIIFKSSACSAVSDLYQVHNFEIPEYIVILVHSERNLVENSVLYCSFIWRLGIMDWDSKWLKFLTKTSISLVKSRLLHYLKIEKIFDNSSFLNKNITKTFIIRNPQTPIQKG